MIFSRIPLSLHQAGIISTAKYSICMVLKYAVVRCSEICFSIIGVHEGLEPVPILLPAIMEHLSGSHHFNDS